jgi:hypothetical protein
VADFSKHKAAQASSTKQLADAARKVGVRALASSTLVLAEKAVTAALSSTTEVALGEAARDLQQIRHDPAFIDALETDLTQSQEAVEEQMLEAMEEGLQSEMTWQVLQIRGLRWRMTDADRMLLSGYPVQGHTVREISKYMHDQLRYETLGLMASPLDGSAPLGSMQQTLGALVTRFGDRTAGAAEEAYYAGVQLGMRLTAEAISNAG